jgi:site-specific DNA-methyltransferase (adenine-specific)
MSSFTLHLGDCLDILPTLPAQSVEAIITDLPYGTTACAWDEVIPFVPMWAEVKRVLKPRGVFVTTASQPFTSKLIMSRADWFKYSWIWDKRFGSNRALVSYQPMKVHEDIVIFSLDTHNYYPQMIVRDRPIRVGANKCASKSSPIKYAKEEYNNKIYTNKFPESIITLSAREEENRVHPTQKPTALYRYLILTYTNPGDTVLDICAGSGTTGVACMETGRNFIGIEKDADYFAIAKRRIENAAAQPLLFE